MGYTLNLGSRSGIEFAIKLVTIAACAAGNSFCADETLDLIYDTDIHDPARVIAHLKLLYKLVGIGMIVSVLVAYILNTVFKTGSGIFWVETAGILSFGTYWLLKSWELRRTAADLKTLRAQTKKTGGKVLSIAPKSMSKSQTK